MFDNLFNFEILIVLWSAVVFLAILLQVLFGTVRLILMVKGKRALSILIGFFEAAIGLSNTILVISNAVKSGINLYIILFYSLGFAAGLSLGMFISQKISKDILSVTIIPKNPDESLENLLRENGFGVTCYSGTGKEGDRKILNIICKKSNLDLLKTLVRGVDRRAMLTAHTIDGLSGGFLFDIKSKI
jgi:uncharacterized protein YebE (UPF0316 family)